MFSNTRNTRHTLWTLAAFSALMLALGGMTLSLAQETRFDLPTNSGIRQLQLSSTPDPFYGDLNSQAIDLLSLHHKGEEPPDFIQVAVRPEALRPAGNIRANYDLPAPASLPSRTPAAQWGRRRGRTGEERAARSDSQWAVPAVLPSAIPVVPNSHS